MNLVRCNLGDDQTDGSSGQNICKASYEVENQGLELNNLFSKVVHSGQNTSFWGDVWLQGKLLKDTFPRLYDLETNKSSTVAAKIKWEGTQWCWAWNWRREPRGRAADGAFTVRRLSRMIASQTAKTFGIETKWCRLVPKKVNVFIWQATRSLIPARAHLHKRGVSINTQLCPLCSSHLETVDHAVISCSYATEVWRCVLLWCNANIQELLTSKDLLNLELHHLTAAKEVWQGIAYIVAWSIWKARNEVVMQGTHWRASSIFANIQVLSYLWITTPNFIFHGRTGYLPPSIGQQNYSDDALPRLIREGIN